MTDLQLEIHNLETALFMGLVDKDYALKKLEALHKLAITKGGNNHDKLHTNTSIWTSNRKISSR